MGEAKRKASQTLTPEVRAAMLGLDPFKVAYDLIYGMVESVYTQTGGVNHELIGLEFEAGKIKSVSVLIIEKTEDVPARRSHMLLKWPMVVHVFEGWAAPDASCPAHAHPDRQDMVAIMLHTQEFMAAASCLVNEKEKSIQRGELVMPTEVHGRLGRSIDSRPLSS